MKFPRTTTHFVGFAALILMWSATVSAQNDTGGTDNAGTGQNPVNIDLGGGPDTSAFDSLDRGAVGSTSTSVGASTAGGGTNTTGRGATGGFGGGGGLGALGALFGGGFGGGGSQAATPIVRTRLRSAINVRPVPQQVVQSFANQHLYQVPRDQGLSGVSVQIQDGTAVLNGSVATDHQRRMSHLLMSLEPGVKRVQNNVIIAPAR